MLRRKKSKQNQCLDRVHREVLLAATVSEEEIEAASNSLDLYDGLRLRIAAERERRAGVPTDRPGLKFLPALLWPRRSSGWILTAAVVLLFVAVGLFPWLPRPSHEETPITEPISALVAPPSGGKDAASGVVAKRNGPSLLGVAPAPKQQTRTHRQRRTNGQSSEIATDFLPLTFSADAMATESGHLVRVTIPRSALVAMGLPVNAERAGELVRAEVFFGDDGLARAIRFIQ